MVFGNQKVKSVQQPKTETISVCVLRNCMKMEIFFAKVSV